VLFPDECPGWEVPRVCDRWDYAIDAAMEEVKP
jgi:hypothetical protein